MKRTAIALTLILAVLLSTYPEAQRIILIRANPMVIPINDFTIELPENKTYAQDSILVAFNYSIPNEPINNHESMQTSISYILDGKESTSFPTYELTSNKLPKEISYDVHANITDLSDGLHTLVIHVAATADQGFTTFAAYSQIATFTINTTSSSTNSTSTLEPFPIVLVVTASGASLAIVGVGLLVYFKKRKREGST